MSSSFRLAIPPLAGALLVALPPLAAAPTSVSRPSVRNSAPIRLAQNIQRPRLVSAAGDNVKIGVGERVTLPFNNVTRIIVEDDEVAGASFLEGSAVLQGVAPGSTIVEVYQTEGAPKVLTIQVESGLSTVPANTGPLTPAPPLTPLPAEPNVAPPSITPSTPEIEPVPSPVEVTPIAPMRSGLTLAMNARPVSGAPGQALFTLSYANPGVAPARNARVRFQLDNRTSYVSGSASDGGVYNAAQREVVWNLGIVPSGAGEKQVSLKVAPIENRSLAFDSVAIIEDDGAAIASAKVRYSTSTTPLLTAFAIPDRFLAGRSGAVLVDVKGSEFQTAVDRLAQMGIVQGKRPGYFYPKDATQRAEYAVMTLNGLNLRDLRDVTQIKYVLGRPSTVNLIIQDLQGRTIATLVRNTKQEAGERTAIWNGRTLSGFAAPGRYTYVCTARDERGETTSLRGYLTIVPQTGLRAEGVPSFVDVKASDWYARYLAVGEKENLLRGFPDKTFRPKQPISRLEATAIVVRAMGLEDTARQWNDKDVGFADYQAIPDWGKGYVNVAATIAKTSSGRPIVRGSAQNTFDPDDLLRRDQAALVVQRLIDRETTRRVSVSGAIAPGALISINSQAVNPDSQGRFAFSFDLNTAQPTTVAVVDARDR